MAQYYFEFGFVSRSGGKSKSGSAYSRSTIAKAAYDSRDKLTDERTGQVYDYRRKGLPEWTGIFLPEDAPKWMRNRQQLWNEVERREDQNKRADSAQPSRTWKIGIPHEFDTPEKRERFVIDYGRTLSRRGYVADLSIHPPETDQRNYHIHAQLVLREVTPDGFGKRIRLNGPEWKNHSRNEMEHQKENFVNLAARHLERYGHQQEADRFRHAHKTLEKQREAALQRGDHDWAMKLDREPEIHLGPAVWAMEQKGIPTRRGDINHEIKERNHHRRLMTQIPIDQRPIEERYLREALPVWWAFNCAKTAEQFLENLKKEKLIIVRATKDDAETSHTRHWARYGMTGGYSPILKEGEYIVVDEKRGYGVDAGLKEQQFRRF